ncbi:Arylsulfatase B [Sarcoptes scabiei]|uniref:Arylsulfatase B n=1 Tax=Sarcoptes scabiei TaxID=52283 RepID=A0A834R6X7_SARSC|nr:Arylsulfatase B [Sarcoptes scabiei]
MFKLIYFCSILVFTKQCLSGRSPNILIILADDLGWGDTSMHGSLQIPTPNIDLLASSGIHLSNYYVSPLCSPSRSALLTGINPIRTGMQVGVIAASEPYGLPLNFTIIPQHFKGLGYQTHAVGKWHQGFFRSDYLPVNRGFDSYLGFLTGHSDYYTRESVSRFKGFDMYEMNQVANLTKYQGQYSTDLYTDRVVQLIEDGKNASRPWFIYMAHQSVHGAELGNELQPPKRHLNDYKYIKNNRRRKFAGMVAALDESIGKIFETLNRTNQLDNTVIFFSTDNGGATGGFDGRHIDRSMGSNWPLKGSKYTLWEGGVKGTAFFWSTKLRPRINHQLMHITDVLPTLFSAAGGDTSLLGDIDGLNHWFDLIESEISRSNSKYSIRSRIVHNIDHKNDFWAIRYFNYKLTNGSIFGKNFDNWYVAPGQTTEKSSKGICYECTDTYWILKELKLNYSILSEKIDCNHKLNPFVKCDSSELCLFDIDRDPCELTDLSQKLPTIVNEIYEKIFSFYDKQYVRPVNKPSDPKADPQLRDGFWRPWLDDNRSG